MPLGLRPATADLNPDLLDLQPGDILCYNSPGVFAWWIRFKTWSDINHVELYLGNTPELARLQFNPLKNLAKEWGLASTDVVPPVELVNRTSAAARGDEGCHFYPTRRGGLRLVLRPLSSSQFSPERAILQMHNYDGMGYDFPGVVASFYARRYSGTVNGKQFCSELVTRLAWAGGWSVINMNYDADAVAPETLVTSPMATWYGLAPASARFRKGVPTAQ